MKFDKQYLTYGEYRELKGTLGEMPFNILEFKARKKIDELTLNRLVNLPSQIQEVKLCMLELISIYKKYENMNQKQSSGIISENTDGYTVNYRDTNIETERIKSNELYNCIRDYLINCKLDDGTLYMYLGVE